MTKKTTIKELKIDELRAIIELNKMIIEDYSNDPDDVFYKGKVATNKVLKKRLAKIK